MVLEEPTLTPELALDALEALAPLTTEVALPTLPILYQDDAMVVVSKPEKMLVHRTEIANGDTVFAMTCVREQLGRYVWPVHRLDRGTSGVLVFALSSEMASKLGRIMMAGDVKKRYVAMTRGWLDAPVDVQHALSLPVDPYLKKRRNHEPQSARTLVWPRGSAEIPVLSGSFETTRLGLVEAELMTGRRHQIRRHLKWLAHPIIGDATYGKGPLNRAVAAHFCVDRLMLHCARMALPHPVTGEWIDCQAPLMGDMQKVFETLGWTATFEAITQAPWRRTMDDMPVLK